MHMGEEKPKTFRETKKLVYKNSMYEIYRIDDDVYQIILQQPYIVVIYNFTKNVIYYAFSPSGYGVDQIVSLLNWENIRKIIQSSKL